MQTPGTQTFSFTVCSCSLPEASQLPQHWCLLVTPKQLQEGSGPNCHLAMHWIPCSCAPSFLNWGRDIDRTHSTVQPFKVCSGRLGECQLQHTWRDMRYVYPWQLPGAELILRARCPTVQPEASWCMEASVQISSVTNPEHRELGIWLKSETQLQIRRIWSPASDAAVVANAVMIRPSSVVLIPLLSLTPWQDAGFLEERREPAAGRAMTPAQGASRSHHPRSPCRWLPSIQLHGQREEEPAAQERLLIAVEFLLIPAEVNVRGRPRFLSTCKLLFSGKCYGLTQGDFVVQVSAQHEGCPSFSFSTDCSCCFRWLVHAARASLAEYLSV